MVECPVDGCRLKETGVCEMHQELQIERRTDTKELADKIEKLVEKIVKLVKDQAYITGWALLVTIMLGGAYVYTKDTKSELSLRHSVDMGIVVQNTKELANQVAENTKEISDQVAILATNSARTEERYSALLRAVETTNKQVEIMMYNDSTGSKKK